MASAFDIGRSGQTVVARWLALPESLDFHELKRSLQVACHLIGGPVKFIALIPESVPPFLAPDTQQTLLILGRDLFSLCLSADFVIEGSSQHRRQLQRLFRGLAESVALEVPMRFHATLDEAMQATGTPTPFTPVPIPLPRRRRFPTQG